MPTRGFLLLTSLTNHRCLIDVMTTRIALLKTVVRVVIGLVCVGVSSHAVSERYYSFQLPEQALPKSLNQVSAQTDTLVLFPYDLVKTHTAPAVHGYLSLQQAVSKLLSGTGLASEITADGALVVSLATSNDGENLMTNKKNLLSAIIAIISGSMVSQTTLAEGENAPAKNLGLEEIVVTAEKRQESLQDVSIAISAFTGSMMRDQGITGIEDLSSMAPGLMVSENGGNVEIAMRGIVTTNFVEAGDSATSFHVDGVYLSRPSSLTGTFFDIERVEILRGPQGTLYGRNANAGNINVITNKPQQEFDADVEVGFGNYSQKSFFGMLNLPISDTLAVRGAVNYLKHDGYIDEAFIEDSYAADEIAARFHALWEPSDDVSLLISADYWKNEGTPSSSVPTPIGGEPKLERRATFSTKTDNDLFGLSAEFNMDFDGFTFTSLTAYRENNRKNYSDSDNNELESQINYANNTQKQISEELRLTSNGEGDLEWVTGLYYLKEEQNIFATFGSLIAPGLGLSFPQPDVLAVSKSIFGQATYHISDTVRVIGGLRYTKDEKSRVGGTYLSFGVDPLDPSYVAKGALLSENLASVGWNKVTWKTGVEWDFGDESMAYLTVGTGFKAGGYFDGVESEDYSVAYDPEEILSWSLGSKNQFYDNRVQVNVEAFLYTYEGFQVSEVDPIPPFGGARGLVTYNADEAEVSGVELETTFLVGEAGMLTGTLALLHSKFNDFEIVRNIDETDPTAVSTVVNYDGNSLPKAPKVTLNVGYNHTWTLNNGAELTGRVSTLLSDDYYLTYENLADEIQGAYAKTDISFSYKPMDKGWHASAYANNITNRLVCSSIGGDPQTCFSNTPRTVGVKFGMNF